MAATRLALELMLDNSDRLSGLANGASPNQSSWIRSTLGLVQLLRLRLRLLFAKHAGRALEMEVDRLLVDLGLLFEQQAFVTAAMTLSR